MGLIIGHGTISLPHPTDRKTKTVLVKGQTPPQPSDDLADEC